MNSLTAVNGRPFHVESSFTRNRSHHASIKALWEEKWRGPCSRGIYPFVDGKVEDFDLVFSELISMDLKEPYDLDEYASAFFPVAEDLEARAQTAADAGDNISACDLNLRAAAVYRIARFPINRSSQTQLAWTRGLAAYLRASPHLSPPNSEVSISHTHGIDSEVGSSIHVFIRLPSNASATAPVPVVIFICGLDAYRTDHTNRTSEHVRRGFACISVEIPGTADSPAMREDPESPDRLWSSLLDWIATQPYLDTKKVTARGVSTGGYYAMRIAHTHAERLVGVVSQGGGCHDMFHPAWIAAQGKTEYPFALPEALAWKFGYGGDLERYKMEAQKKFSLLENGLLDRKSCRLLVINGVEDEIFPIEDSELLLRKGIIKDARLIEGRFHMGNPEAEPMVYDWLDQFV